VLTGAAGAIGSELRRALGARVGSLRLVDWAPISELGEREQVAVVDLADLESLVAACDGADGVVHLAGIADEADFHALAETNVVGTYHALEAARRNGVPRFIYASSNRVTGFYDVAERVTPDFPARPDGFYDVSRSPPRRFAGSTATSSGSPSRRFASAASSRRRRSRDT
jgi:nucleoside-diphosphate-sugar epimerase